MLTLLIRFGIVGLAAAFATLMKSEAAGALF